MSAWAYRQCEICNSSVYINYTCHEWNGEDCLGDPWNVIDNSKELISKLNKRKEKLEKEIKEMDEDLLTLKKKIKKYE